MWEMKNIISILLLVATAQSASLTCEYVTIGVIKPTCTVIGLHVTQINETISVTNPAFPNYFDNETIILNIYPSAYMIIQEFPRIFDIFTYLSAFQIQNISMTELPTDAFYNCNYLISINIDNSVINHIRARIASTCSSLRRLHMAFNKIQSIDENAFEGMISLETLHILESELICIPPNLFQPLKSVEIIHFSGNYLTALHTELFKNLEHLSRIFFYDNLIEYIPCFDLTNTGINHTGNKLLWESKLEMILQDNPIKAICPSLLSYFQSINIDQVDIYFGPYDFTTINTTCVDLNIQLNTNYDRVAPFVIGTGSPNWIQDDATLHDSTTCYSDFTPAMADNSLVACGVLTTTSSFTTESTTLVTSPTAQCASDKVCRFYLDWNNQYTCVIDGAEGTVTSITGNHYLTYTNADVKRVYFINSHLSLVPKILFQKFPNLKFLHTANSGMTVINDQTFNECGVLELWDASDNDISRVDETSLRNCTNLRIIDLTGNPIDFVSQGLYQLDPALERIHLTRLDDWTLA